MWYIYEVDNSTSFVSISVDRVKQIIDMNKNGKIPETLKDSALESDQKFDTSFIIHTNTAVPGLAEVLKISPVVNIAPSIA